MSTVTPEQYILHTGDTFTNQEQVQTNLDLAESMVESFLRRELASKERTETMKLWPGNQVFPKHVPVTSIPSSAYYDLYDEARIRFVDADLVTTDVGRWPVELDDFYPHSLPQATITYTGGWTEATLPETIVRVVCKVAQQFNNPQGIPQAGVQTAAVGDVNITYNDAAGRADTLLDSLFPMATAMLTPFKWRPR